MANLTPEQLINKAQKYSKSHVRNNSIYMGGADQKKHLFNFTRDYDKLYHDVYGKVTQLEMNIEPFYRGSNAEIANIIDDIVENLASLPFYHLERKELSNINSFISKISLLVSEINKKEPKLDLDNPVDSGLLKSYAETLGIYKEAIESTSKYYREVEKELTFSAQTYSDTINEINLSAVRDEDMALARAFSFIGSPIKFNGNEWTYDASDALANPNGIKFTGIDGKEQIYKLPEDNINAFLKGYLNAPVEERKGVISPSGLFRFYVESVISDASKFKGVDKSVIEELQSKAKLEFSTENLLWKSFQIADEAIARQDAIRLSLGDFFISQFDQQIGEDVYSDDLQRAIDEDERINKHHADRVLDNLAEYAENNYRQVVSRLNDQTYGFVSFENLISKYSKEHSLLNQQLAVNGGSDSSIRERMNAVMQSGATLIGLRSFQNRLIENILEEQENKEILISIGSSKDKDDLNTIRKAYKDLGTFDFLKVQEMDGKWNLVIDESMVPDEYMSSVLLSFEQVKDTIHNEITQKMLQGFDLNYNLSETQLLRLSTEEIYDYCWFADLGGSSSLNQLLVDEAIYDRTCRLLNGPNNIFKSAIQSYLDTHKEINIHELTEELNTLSGGEDGIDNFLFTEDSLSTYFNKEKRENMEKQISTSYVLMDRIGRIINENPEYQKALRNNSPELRNIMIKAYNEAIRDMRERPAKPDEIARSKKKFENLNKKKDFERLQNFIDNPGDEPRNLINELIQDEELRDQVYDHAKAIENDYQKDLQDEKDDLFKGEEPDKEVDKNKSKEAPKTYKELFIKNDGSATMKKLKPYCKKSCEKFIDDIIKMIDGTKIYPKAPVTLPNSNEQENKEKDTKKKLQKLKNKKILFLLRRKKSKI